VRSRWANGHLGTHEMRGPHLAMSPGMLTQSVESLSLTMELLIEPDAVVTIRAGELAVSGSGVDVRTNGVFVETDARLPFGTRVEVELHELGMVVPGIVRWQNARGIGVHYEVLRPRELRTIHQHLSRLH
jgi:hypothetical protein